MKAFDACWIEERNSATSVSLCNRCGRYAGHVQPLSRVVKIDPTRWRNWNNDDVLERLGAACIKVRTCTRVINGGDEADSWQTYGRVGQYADTFVKRLR